MKEDTYVFSQYAHSDKAVKLIMAGISYCDSSYYIERSNYHYYVIEHIIDGEGVLEVDGEHYDLKARDTYFLYKGKGHRYYCKNNLWTKLWVVIDGELADALFDSYLYTRPNVLYGFDIFRNMQNLIELAKNKDITYDELTRQTAVIIHKILISAEEFSETSTNDFHKIIKNYIDDNLEKPLKLDELSQKYNYSKNHIINIFRDKYDVTPYAYYEGQRMLVARELLANTSISISEVSAKLGFENPQYFSKCFKKHFKISPTQFRRL